MRAKNVPYANRRASRRARKIGRGPILCARDKSKCVEVAGFAGNARESRLTIRDES